MPDHWIRFLLSESSSGLLAIVAGAVVRGLASVGPWVWREFFVSLGVAIPVGLYAIPYAIESLEWGQAGNNMLCLATGMLALPAAQGILSMGRYWRDHAQDIIKRRME